MIRWIVKDSTYFATHPATGAVTVHSAVRVQYPEGMILLSQVARATAAAKRHAAKRADGSKVSTKVVYNVGATAAFEVVAYWD